MKILKRESLEQFGFAGLKEHRLVKGPRVLTRMKTLMEAGLA